AVDHGDRADLTDVGALPDQLRVLEDRGFATAGLDHHLDVRAVARLERPGLEDREVTLGITEERPVAPEQGPVEVGVGAAEGHRREPEPQRWAAVGCCGYLCSMAVRLRPGAGAVGLERPLAVGLANVAADTLFGGTLSRAPAA